MTEVCVWPCLTNTQIAAFVIVPIIEFFAIWFLLRVVYPPPEQEAVRKADEGTHLLFLDEGTAADSYDEYDWKDTFDMVFLVGMLVSLGALLVATALYQPYLFTNLHFWLMQLPKVGVMMTVSLLGGILCRYFCEVDSKGYIITNKNSIFKVNYTRKLQHFAAYAVPLFLVSGEKGVLSLAWGDWFTCLGFMILIKPLRERSTFIMLQFNSLDRPEDRPNTLNWIVAGNIIPGFLLIIFFRWLYSFTGQEALSYIFIMITGIGDGFAEPVGYGLGKHKYWTKAFMSDRRYKRSYEGSACVFISCVVFCCVYWYAFDNEWQMWIAALILSPTMTYAEAVSPHTLDTPFLMTLGGFVLWFVTHLTVNWH